MSLENTTLLELRANYPSELDNFEWRDTKTGALNSALRQTAGNRSILSTDTKAKAMMSEGRSLNIPVITKGNVTLGNARSCTIQASDVTSELVQVTWATITADLSMTPAINFTNEISYQEELRKQLENISEEIRKTLDTALITTLDGQKSQVYNSSLVGAAAKYPLVGDAVQYTQAQKDFFYNDEKSILMADDINTDNLAFIGSSEMTAQVNQYINQGVGNAVNTSYVYNGYTMDFSNRVSNGTGVEGTAYIMEEGSLGFLTRVDELSKRGAQSTSGAQWYEDSIPGLPFTVGIKFKSECADESTYDSHLSSTLKEYWQISFDYAIVTPYMSGALATTPSPFSKVESTQA